jgi:hypothetical protein
LAIEASMLHPIYAFARGELSVRVLTLVLQKQKRRKEMQFGYRSKPANSI